MINFFVFEGMRGNGKIPLGGRISSRWYLAGPLVFDYPLIPKAQFKERLSWSWVGNSKCYAVTFCFELCLFCLL